MIAPQKEPLGLCEDAVKRLGKRKNRRTMLFFISGFLLLFFMASVSAVCVDWIGGEFDTVDGWEFDEWCCDKSSWVPIEIVDDDLGYCCPSFDYALSPNSKDCVFVSCSSPYPYIRHFSSGTWCVKSVDAECGNSNDCLSSERCLFDKCVSDVSDVLEDDDVGFFEWLISLIRSLFGFGSVSPVSSSDGGGSR